MDGILKLDPQCSMRMLEILMAVGFAVRIGLVILEQWSVMRMIYVLPVRSSVRGLAYRRRQNRLGRQEGVDVASFLSCSFGGSVCTTSTLYCSLEIAGHLGPAEVLLHSLAHFSFVKMFC